MDFEKEVKKLPVLALITVKFTEREAVHYKLGRNLVDHACILLLRDKGASGSGSVLCCVKEVQ